METLALISSPRLQWRSSPPLSRPILNSASPFVVSTSNKTHFVVVQTRDFSRESCSRGARNPSGKISINVLEKSGLEAFARISSSSEENSSVAVNTQKFVQLPPSRIGSPFFWIGVLVGISALIYWVAKNLKTKAVVKPKRKPLRIMISGAPASGKGTQCELITKKYGLVHIAAGDLLRAEVAAGSENGKRAKEYMEKGQLVPNEIVVMMVKDRLLQPDAQENGWLLDGYPRSYSQAKALEDLGIRPDLFILLDVPEEILVERVVGRRLDPVTGKIYHLKYSPPENEEIASRLTQRFDDTEEKVKLRLHTHHQNVEDVLSIYKDLTLKINGNIPKEDVFAQIDNALTGLLDQKKATPASEAISR